MRQETLIAIAMVLVAVFAVRAWQDRQSVHERALDGSQATSKPIAPPKRTSNSGYYAREVRVSRAANAQFYTDARVNGRSLNFLIDTGATFVALRESDARRAGIYLSPADFTVSISTANGKTNAARVALDEVDIEGISVTTVNAFVLPDDRLNVNLLGMSYLSKLEGFKTEDGQLVLKG